MERFLYLAHLLGNNSLLSDRESKEFFTYRFSIDQTAASFQAGQLTIFG
jgi:hypothetical protein